MNPIATYKTVGLGPELSTTPVAGANDTVIGTSKRKYLAYTMPAASTFYRITGIEWLNGTVAAGSVFPAIELIDADPPVSNINVLVAWGIQTSQSGTSAVQRCSRLISTLVPGGSILGIFFSTDNATARFGTTTVASANNERGIAATAVYQLQTLTAWTATTEQAYIKLYYKAVT